MLSRCCVQLYCRVSCAQDSGHQELRIAYVSSRHAYNACEKQMCARRLIHRGTNLVWFKHCRKGSDRFSCFIQASGCSSFIMSNASSPPLRCVVGMTLATSSASSCDFAFDRIFDCLDDSGEEDEHGKNGSSTTPTTYAIVGAKAIATMPPPPSPSHGVVAGGKAGSVTQALIVVKTADGKVHSKAMATTLPFHIVVGGKASASSPPSPSRGKASASSPPSPSILSLEARPTAVKSMGLRSRSRSKSLPSHRVIAGKAAVEVAGRGRGEARSLDEVASSEARQGRGRFHPMARSRSRSRSLPSHGAVATTLPSPCRVDPWHAVVEVADSQVDVEDDDPWLQLLQSPALIPLAADPGPDVVDVAESQVEEDEAVDLFDRPETAREARRRVNSMLDALQLRREVRERQNPGLQRARDAEYAAYCRQHDELYRSRNR